ncbi:MAG: dihydroorotate dehydrogenase-like protein [Alistipes sp.]|nr:dihydroorotate dehydrogenase-like protein [Alistipes sp.]
MNLQVSYMGLKLANPVIVASSPFTSTAATVKKCAEAGAGAVVLKSVFEEQIRGEAGFLEVFNDYPEAADYLNNYLGRERLDEQLCMIREVKQSVDIPVIASINCQSQGSWVDYARSMEAAGADALELNIYVMPTDAGVPSHEIEEHYLMVLREVAQQVSIPVSVKLNNRFTNVLNICREIYYRGGRGVVMFNRMFEPDFDIENIALARPADTLSSPGELRNSLRTVSLCSPEVPLLDISVSTGVYSGADAVKCLLAGAKAVQVCSAITRDGFEAIQGIKDFMACWMERHNFNNIEDFRGLLSRKDNGNNELYQRVQYMRFFPSK